MPKARGRYALRLLGFAAVIALTAAVPARAQDDVRARLDQLQNDIETLNRAVYKGEAPPPAPAMPMDTMSGEGAAELQTQMSRIESSLASLTGRVEEQQHQIETLQRNFDEAISRLDQRLSAVERLGAGAAIPPQPGTDGLQPADQAPPPGSASDEGFGGGTASPLPSDSGVPPQPTSPQSATAPSSPNAIPGEQPAILGTLTQPSSPPSAPATSSTIPAAPASPDGAYEHAYTLLKTQDFEGAAREFEAFLAKYPSHKLAPNAKYWLGETYYARKQYDKAARNFAEAYQKYPKSPKAADALLKLGLTLSAKGDKKSACLSYAQLKKQFPDAGPVLARGEQEAAKAGCK